MAKDIDLVIGDSQLIKVETIANANTAARIGGNLKDLGQNIKVLYENYDTNCAKLDSTNTFLANQHYEGSLDIDGNVLIKAASGLTLIANVEGGPEQKIYHLNGNGAVGNNDIITLGDLAGYFKTDGTEILEGSLRIQTPGAGSKVILLDDAGHERGLFIHNRSTGQISIERKTAAGVVESKLMLGSHAVSMKGPAGGEPEILNDNDLITKKYLEDNSITADEKGALEHAPIPLTAANPIIDATTFDNHATDWNLHLGSDQNAAFDNANAPKGTNPLATMADLPTPPPPPDPMTFDFMKVANVLDIGDAYEDVVSLVTPSRSAGVYTYNMALTYNYNKATTSVHIRFSTDDGVTWFEFISEPKDRTDDVPMFYAFPKVIDVDGILQLKIQMKKEDTAGVLNVHFVDVWIDQKI